MIRAGGKEARLQDHMRYYDIAGMTVRVQSELPITEATFHRKFASFLGEGPGPDTVEIRHHFGLPHPIPGMDPAGRPKEVYRKPPWAIYSTSDSWVYLGIAPSADDPSLHRVAIFNLDHSRGDIYNPKAREQTWRRGGLAALTMFPSDQILLARLLADRSGCLLHSGGLIIDGQGFVFAGHSDAGKSTTMELAQGRLGSRAEILCDDRNIVRHWPEGFRNGPAGFYVHGTWSHGDVPETSSAAAPLRGILFLEQHERNEIIRLSERKQIWERLLATLIKPLTTADWWQKEMDVLERIVAEVPCYTMRFDKSGAIIDELEKLAQ